MDTLEIQDVREQSWLASAVDMIELVANCLKQYVVEGGLEGWKVGSVFIDCT